VVVGARRAAELDELVAEIAAAGGSAVALAGDVRSEAYAQALVALAVQRYGRLDVAFNNAGIWARAAQHRGLGAGWADTLAINLTGAFLGAKHQIAQMQNNGGGSVIFTSTFVGHTVSFPAWPPTLPSKSGLIGLTQTLAAEYGPRKAYGSTPCCPVQWIPICTATPTTRRNRRASSRGCMH
jgi:NAD(P)-dependent dehydrogenase (short-subunit alcohol dehydrogenase family)